MKNLKTGNHYHLFLMVIISMLFTFGYAQTTITVGNATGAPGSQVNVDITISDSSSIAGMNFGVSFDPTIVSNPSVAKGGIIPAEFTLESNLADNYRFLFYKDPTGNITTGGGTIATLTFTIAPGANGGAVSPINIVPANFGVSNDQGVSTTGNYVIQNGSITVSGPAMPIVDDFDPNDTWTFWATPFGGGLPSADKVEVAGSIGFGVKDIAGDENDYLQAAWYRNFNVAPPAKLPIVTDNLYRATLTMRSDMNKAQVPELRFRASSQNFQRSNLMSIVSAADGEFSPGSVASNYNSYFIPAQNAASTENVLVLDLIKIEPADKNITGNIYMDQFILTRTGLSGLGTPTLVQEFTFEADNEGWLNTQAWGTWPAFSYASGKITITGSPESGNTENNYGFWQNNVDIKPVILEANKLYRATYKVSTTQSDITKVPVFRCRVNALNFQSNYISLIDSVNITDSNIAPNAAGKEYAVYFVADGTQVGQKAIFAFDYLNLGGTGDSGDVSLENLKIETIDIPTMY